MMTSDNVGKILYPATVRDKAAARTVRAYDPDASAEDVARQASAFAQLRGDDSLLDAEAMLMSQAQTLDSLFHLRANLAQSMLKHPELSERYMRQALRCQNQCRQTLAALVELKNPKRAVFIKRQQNLLHVEQQTDESLKIGADDSAKMDSRSTEKATPVNQNMETMDCIYRS